MRLIAGIAMIVQDFTRLGTEPYIIEVLGAGAGALLIAGLWTPISATLVAVLGIWNIITQPGDPRADILLGTIGAALAMLGPGIWSVDARLFGWKHIDIPAQDN
jgi:hypothetical protein